MDTNVFLRSALAALAATIAALAAVVTVAAPEARAQTAAVPVMNCAQAAAENIMDVNNVRAKIMNNGGLFWNGGDTVYEVPKHGGVHAIFASGIWVAGLVDGNLHTSGSNYGPWEFWPGPYDAVAQGQDCADFDRIYKVDRRDLIAIERGEEPGRDVIDWPWQLGAPVVDGDGNPDNYDLAAGDRPLLVGDETHWWVMNDIGNEHLNTERPALGLEVQGMAFSSASTESEHLKNTTFYEWTLVNKSPNVIDSMRFSLFVDADLGNFDDDYVGSDTTLGLGFFYNADNDDEGHYGLNPPAVGFLLMEAPTDMTALTFFNGGGGVQGDPLNGEAYWSYMNARWQDGQPMTLGGGARSYSDVPIRHVFPGDPESRAFWSEVNSDSLGRAIPAADRRIVLTAGPFYLAPGAAEKVLIAIPTAFGSNHLNSVTVLKEASAELRGLRVEDLPVTQTSGVAPQRAPRVVNVASGAMGQPLDLELRWEGTGLEEEFYEVILEAEGGDVRSWEQLSRTLRPGLEPGTNYVLRLRAGTDHAFGPWSEDVAFSTGSVRFAGAAVFKGFRAARNAAGPIVPSVGAAADFQGFPGATPRANADQQVGEGKWMFHTFDVGANLSSFDAFLSRSVLGRANGFTHIVGFDFEMRFTADGSHAWNRFTDGSVVRVPFELWRSAIGTPEDASDDVRLIPWIIDWDGDGYGIQCADHSGSGGSNDPELDAVYWHLPSDTTPGQSGYNTWAEELVATGDGAGPAWGPEIMARTTLFNWNGGDVADCEAPQAWNAPGPSRTGFNQDIPEEGTVFRITTALPPVPIPSAPANEAVLPAGPVTFYWTAFRGDAARFEVARDREFRQLLLVLEGAASGRAQMTAAEPGTYWWRVTDEAGGVSEPVRFFVGTAVGVEGSGVAGDGSAVGDDSDGGLPTEFALGAPWPNPARGRITVPFEVPRAARVQIRVFDVIGREVALLVDRDLPAGRHEAAWDGGGGVYIVRMQAGSFTTSRVVTVL